MKTTFYPSVDFPEGSVSITPVHVMLNEDGIETDFEFETFVAPHDINVLISTVTDQGRLYHIDEEDPTPFKHYFNIYNISDELLGGFHTDAHTFMDIVLKNNLIKLEA